MDAASAPRAMGTGKAVDTLLRLEKEEATGRLDFSTELGRAQVYLRQGVLVAAMSGDLNALPALFRLLSAGEAYAEFVAETVPPTPPLVENVAWLVAERRARTERWQELCRQAPPLFAPLLLTDRGRQELAGGGLAERQRRVMAEVDGQRNVTEVLVASGLEALDAIEAVAQCTQAGLLVGHGEVPATPAEQTAPLVSATPAPTPAERPVVPAPAPAIPVNSAAPRQNSVQSVAEPVQTAPQPASPAPAASSAPKVPVQPATAGVLARIGPYEIVRRLGRGDHGPVFECRREGSHEQLALKLFRGTHGDSNRERFYSGLKIARTMNHPNLVKIVDGGETVDGIFVVSRLVTGLSLRDLLNASPKERPPDRIVRIILDVLAGLSAAKNSAGGDGRRRLLIADLSPENLLVGADGLCRLLDYGLATPGDPVIRGKAAYLAPEQILRGQADERSNLFSVGIVMYNALTGTELFRGETLRESLHLVCTKPLQLPSSMGLAPPAELDAICSRALEREPDRRFGSAVEMTRELSKAVDKTPLLTTHGAVAEWVKSLMHSP